MANWMRLEPHSGKLSATGCGKLMRLETGRRTTIRPRGLPVASWSKGFWCKFGMRFNSVGLLASIERIPLRSQSGLPDLRHPCGPSAQSYELTLLDPGCQFDPSDDHRGIVETFQPQHGTQPLFHSSMVLLYDVIQILTAAHFHSLRQFPALF